MTEPRGRPREELDELAGLVGCGQRAHRGDRAHLGRVVRGTGAFEVEFLAEGGQAFQDFGVLGVAGGVDLLGPQGAVLRPEVHAEGERLLQRGRRHFARIRFI